MAREIIENYVTDDNPFFARFTRYALSRVCRASPNSLNLVTTRVHPILQMRPYLYTFAFGHICRRTWKVYTVSTDGDLARRLPRARYFSTAGHVYTSRVRNIAQNPSALPRGIPLLTLSARATVNRGTKFRHGVRAVRARYSSESSRARQTHVECTWTWWKDSDFFTRAAGSRRFKNFWPPQAESTPVISRVSVTLLNS